MILELDIFSKDYQGGNGGICGDAYLRLLDLCFAHADYFSLCDENPAEWKTIPNTVEDLLMPYRKKTLKTRQWFGYFSTEPPLTVSLYQANEETKRILSACYSDLFFENQKKVPKKHVEQIGRDFVHLQRPEDLCFFKDRRIFFGTVSHELICTADCPDEAFETELRALAPFREPQPVRDHTPLPWRGRAVEIPKEPLDGWKVFL